MHDTTSVTAAVAITNMTRSVPDAWFGAPPGPADASNIVADASNCVVIKPDMPRAFVMSPPRQATASTTHKKGGRRALGYAKGALYRTDSVYYCCWNRRGCNIFQEHEWILWIGYWITGSGACRPHMGRAACASRNPGVLEPMNRHSSSRAAAFTLELQDLLNGR